MPQSSIFFPLPISLRACITRATTGWSMNPSGAVVSRSVRRLSSSTGTAVSAWSVHLVLRNGVQSTAYLRWKFDNVVLAVCRPSSRACRYAAMRLSGSPSWMTPSVISFSAYRRRVP